jgi:hypothetical protein
MLQRFHIYKNKTTWFVYKEQLSDSYNPIFEIL